MRKLDFFKDLRDSNKKIYEKIVSLFDSLLSCEPLKRCEISILILDIFQKNEILRNYILDRVMKGMKSTQGDTKQGFTTVLLCLVDGVDDQYFSLLVEKAKEILFKKEMEDCTPKEVKSVFVGSTLVLDTFLSSGKLFKIDDPIRNEFISFVIGLILDENIGFFTTVIVCRMFCMMSDDQFKAIAQLLSKDLFNVKHVESNPHLLMLWACISDNKKLILKKRQITVPNLSNDNLLSNVMKILRVSRHDQALWLLESFTFHSKFLIMWKSIEKEFVQSASEKEFDVKKMSVILQFIFKIIIPSSEGILHLLEPDKRLNIVEVVWKHDAFVLNSLFNQLENSNFTLHSQCSKFISDLFMCKDKTFKTKLFKMLMMHQDFIEKESKINPSLRLSRALINSVDLDVLNSYYAMLVDTFKNDKYSAYCVEQMTAMFLNNPNQPMETLEFVVRSSITCKGTMSNRMLFDCLDAVKPLDNLDGMKSLLVSLKPLCDPPIQKAFDTILNSWPTDAHGEVGKKRRISESENVMIDSSSKIDGMFLHIMVHFCLYIAAVEYDPEYTDIVNDLCICFKECRSNAQQFEICSKKAKLSTSLKNDTKSTPKWQLIFVDVLICLLQQGLGYLRNLSVDTFEMFVRNGLCDTSIIDHIKSSILSISKSPSNVTKDQCCDGEAEEFVSDDSKSSSDDDHSDQEDLEIRNRMLAALASIKADVNSDDDDNCPDVGESNDGDTDSDELPLSANSNVRNQEKKIKKKADIELRHFRNRCLNLLDKVVLDDEKIECKIQSICVMVQLLHKPDADVEDYLMTAVKHFHPRVQQLTHEELIKHINSIIESMEKCVKTKKLSTAISDILKTLIKLRKDDMEITIKHFASKILDGSQKKRPEMSPFTSVFGSTPVLFWLIRNDIVSRLDGDWINAASLLYDFLSNSSVRAIVEANGTLEYLNLDDLKSFVTQTCEKLVKILTDLVEKDKLISKNSRSGVVIDCLRASLKYSRDIYQLIKPELMDKIHKVNRKGTPNQLRTTIRKFESAMNLAK